MGNKLHRKERLRSKKLIDTLFSNGDTLFVYPFKIYYQIIQNDKTGNQFLVSVSRKKFSKAVQRNRIKRLTREAFRLHKHNLYNSLDKHNKSIIFGLIYVGDTILSFNETEQKIILILQCLTEQHEKDPL